MTRSIAMKICSMCCLLVMAGVASLSGGCASAVQAGVNPALDGIDLQTMTDQMAMSLMGDPEIQSAIAQRGSLKIVVQPAENYMTGEVLSPGAAFSFTARLRDMLARQSRTQFTWIMNRDAWYRLRAGELEGVDAGPSPEAINPQYTLTAKFHSLTNVSSRGRTNAYLCVYELVDIQNRSVLWTDKYEVKKSAVKGFLD